MVTSVVTVPDGQEEVKPAGRKRRQDASCVDLRGCHHGVVLGGCTIRVEPQATASPTAIGSPSEPSTPLGHRHPVWRARRRSWTKH
jgi:hypothetical protein